MHPFIENDREGPDRAADDHDRQTTSWIVANEPYRCD